MQNDKLLPCPFCGEEPRFRIYDLKGYKGCNEYVIRCTECEIQFKEKDVYVHPFVAKQRVTEKWNTRKPMERILEQLEEVSFERFGNAGMGGELVVNFDDAIEIVKGGVDNAG